MGVHRLCTSRRLRHGGIEGRGVECGVVCGVCAGVGGASRAFVLVLVLVRFLRGCWCWFCPWCVRCVRCVLLEELGKNAHV